MSLSTTSTRLRPNDRTSDPTMSGLLRHDDKEILARTRPPPVDVPVDGHFAGRLTPQLSYELHGWVLLALAALALAGLLALVLAVSRTPGVENVLPFMTQDFFRRVLIVHVTFAFV